MTELSTRETIADDVNRKFYAMLIEEIVDQLPDEDLRRRLTVPLCEKFEVPDRGDYTSKGMAMTLVGCRLKEDSISNRDTRAERRGFLVGLVTEAIMAFEGKDIGIAADILVKDEPKSEVQNDGATLQSTESDNASSVTFDLSEEINTKPAEGPARFTAAPPDLTLFPGSIRCLTEVPDHYISLLVPPPALTAGDRRLSAWITGDPVTSSSFSLGIGDLDEQGHQRMIEVEAEFLASPKILLERYDHRVVARDPALKPEKERSEALLEKMQGQSGETNASDMEVLSAFRHAVARTLQEVWPEKAKGLHGIGATLRCGADLMPMLRQAWSMEQCWLEEFGGALEGREQNIIGSPHPEGMMEPGLLFRRAVFIHFIMGKHMADALLDAGLDLRYSMALRDQDVETVTYISETFDDAFMEDCARPVSSYRIAKNEIEPAF
ncbi:hypothetical protein KUV57_12055 [Epibacterium sp. DP7N7-1]|nr:hypothetical protein [Epibacterium sp. DP7N7-1]